MDALAQEREVTPLDVDEALRELPALIKGVQGPILRRGVQPVHEAFADYMLLNPGCKLIEMKAQFGYSICWISTVINSDMFKAYMHKRRDGINAAIAEDLPSKLRAAAHLATEKLIDVIEKSEDADTLIDAFDKVLHRYGYAPNAKTGAQAPAIGVQNNVFYLGKGDLAAAREKLIGAHSVPALENKGEHDTSGTAGVPVPGT